MSAENGVRQAQASPLLYLIDLGRRAREAGSEAELRFLLVNESRALLDYRQAALWSAHSGIQALSGVVQVEANAPYALWLAKVCQYCAQSLTDAAPVDADTLPPALRADWEEWLPPNGLWLPIRPDPRNPGGVPSGLLIARDLPWTQQETQLVAEWVDVWRVVRDAMHQPPILNWRQWWGALVWNRAKPAPAADAPSSPPIVWWKRRATRWAAGFVLVSLLPMRLSVLVPGELVPAKPHVIRAPLDGVIDAFYVQPNDVVKKGQPLFGFDEALIRSRLDVALQANDTARVEYEQTMQQALNDAKSKALLAPLTGRIEEKRTEAAFVQEQLKRARVLATHDGTVMFDDPAEWIGRPVTVGERIMRLAEPDDVEVEVWIGAGDAIPLPQAADVSLYLNASPLSPVSARIRYMMYEAVERPDGTYAYRARATLTEKTNHRVGLKGTARISGRWVPLGYWVLRRPWAGIRSMIGR